MHTVFALLCFVVVIHWLIFSYPLGLLHWHCGNLTIAPVPAKQPWWIWINTSCEFIMNDCITTTKQSTTKPCAYFLGYTVGQQCSSVWVLCVFVVDCVQQHQSRLSNKLDMMFNIMIFYSHEWWTDCHYGREHCSLLLSCIHVISHYGCRKHTDFQCFVAWSVIHCTQLLEWDHLQQKRVCIVLIREQTHLK